MAARHAKFACSVEPAVLARIERVRSLTGERRSAVVSRALRKLAESEEQAARIRRYVAAYREQPETAEEVESAGKAARRVLRHLPWKAP